MPFDFSLQKYSNSDFVSKTLQGSISIKVNAVVVCVRVKPINNELNIVQIKVKGLTQLCG